MNLLQQDILKMLFSCELIITSNHRDHLWLSVPYLKLFLAHVQLSAAY